MTGISELAPGLLVLTALEPIDGRVPWLPPEATGIEPYNTYLLRQEDRALLLDTGVAKHGPALVATLRELVGSRRLAFYATRIEPDSLGGLAAALAAFPEASVVTCNPISPVALTHQLPGTSWRGGPVIHLKFGDDLGAVGFPGMVAMEPVLRMLNTSWLHDRASGTLFPSDSLCWEMLPDAETPVIRRDAQDLPDIASLRAHARAKFDWLAQADCSIIAAHWDRVFATLHPRAIAPMRGRVMAGEAVVAEMLPRYRAAIVGE
jgi:flavorubredoxin